MKIYKKITEFGVKMMKNFSKKFPSVWKIQTSKWNVGLKFDYSGNL